MFGRQDEDNQQVNGDGQNHNGQPEPADDGTLEINNKPEESADLPAPDNGDSQPGSDDSGKLHDPQSSKPVDDNGLLALKQQALHQLSPLVDHLDQTPEEKFKTTMMMIQAADDQSLIPRAYEAAGKINDKKVRAQALLDIVNEINYFTHK